MTTKTDNVEVEKLYHADINQSPISKNDLPEWISPAEAYTIQHQLLDKKAKMENDQHVGYKISLTSEETQKLFHASSPLYGALTETSISDGTIELNRMLSPLIEMELMLFVNESITLEDDEDTILQKVSIAPGIEIPDSRFYDWFPKLGLGQVIADRAVAGKVVFGEPIKGISLEQLENINGELTLDGETIARGNSSEVLGNPIHAMKWLVQELSKSGRGLEKGMLVSSGTFILPQTLQRGTYEVEFEYVGNVKLQVL